MRAWHKISMIGLVIVVIIALVVACAPEVKPVAPKEEVEVIPIGLNLELTGAVSSVTMPPSYAYIDYFTSINDKGGLEYTGPDGKVHKAKYDVMWADNGFSVARSVSIVNRFYEKGAKVILTP